MHGVLRFTSFLVPNWLVIVLFLCPVSASAQNVLHGGTALQGNGGKRLTVTQDREKMTTVEGLLTVPGAASAGVIDTPPDGTFEQSRRRAASSSDSTQGLKDAAELFELYGRRTQSQPPYVVSRATLGLSSAVPLEQPLLVAGRIFSSAAQAAGTRSRLLSPSTTDALLSGPSVAAAFAPHEKTPESLRDEARSLFHAHTAERRCLVIAGGLVVSQAACANEG